jgi:hypothetical protein
MDILHQDIGIVPGRMIYQVMQNTTFVKVFTDWYLRTIESISILLERAKSSHIT